MSTIGEYFAGLLLRGVDEGVDAPGIVQSFHGTPADGSYELPTGSPGPAGPTGPAAYPIRWEGDISDPVALAALAADLGPAHAGQAWRVLSTDTVMVWNGAAFEAFAEAFGAAGPEGMPNTLTLGTIETGAAGSDLAVTLTGTSPAQTADLVIPRGVKGAKGPLGPPGPLRGAADYDNTVTHVNGLVPLWDDTAEMWHPTPYPGWRGPWTIAEAAAWDGGPGFVTSVTGSNVTPNTIATLTVPAQDTAWRPFVLGSVLVRSGSSTSDVSTRVDAEARLGDASGQIVALGAGFGNAVDWPIQIVPCFATASMTPDSSVGVVAAGVAATIAIVLRRNIGTNAYSYFRTGAHVAVWAVPTTGAPA